jgi:hypothetical protein
VRPLSAWRRHNPTASGPKREPLDSSPAKRNLCRFKVRGPCQSRIATALDIHHKMGHIGSLHKHKRSTGPRSGERGREHLNAQHEQTRPMLQRGRALVSAGSFWRYLKNIWCASYSENRSGLERLAARIVIFTGEPFFRAGRKIGASAVPIESLQQSALNSRSPGFRGLFLFTRTISLNCF